MLYKRSVRSRHYRGPTLALDEMMRLVRACIGTKFSSRYGDLIVRMAVDAVKAVTIDVSCIVIVIYCT